MIQSERQQGHQLLCERMQTERFALPPVALNFMRYGFCCMWRFLDYFPQQLFATRLHEVVQASEKEVCTSQLFTLPSGNLHTLTFSPWPMFSPVFTSEGTPSSEFSLYGPALLASKYSSSTLGP